MHKKRIYLNRFLIVFILFLFCLFAESQYTYSIQTYPSEDVTWTQHQNARYQLDQFSLDLSRGEYEITLHYTLPQDETCSFFWLADPSRFSQDGEPFIIAEGQLDADHTSITIPISLGQDIYDINIICEHPLTIKGWDVNLVKSGNTDWLFLFLALVCLLFILTQKTNWELKQYPVLLIFVGIFLSLPYAGNRLMGILGQDLDFHMTRIKAIADALASGQFPVRMNTFFNWGYGYINDILYPELFLYIPALFYLLGMSLISAYKTLILLINISTGLIGYYSFSKLFNSNKLGTVCSILYLLNPYRLNNIFLRAAIGEALAETFLPLLIYGAVELIRRDYKKWYIFVIAATGILQSHILSLEISALFLIFFIIVSWKYFRNGEMGKRMLCWLKAAIVFLGINLWFLFPFFDHFTRGYNLIKNTRNVSDSSVNLWQMFFSFIDMKGLDVPNGIANEMPLTIGVSLLIGSFVFIYYSYYRHTLSEALQKTGRLCLAFGGISCYMASEYFPWLLLKKNLPAVYTVFAKMQFPWRMLGFSCLFLCIVTTIGLHALWTEKKQLLPNILLLLSILVALRCMDGYLTDESVMVDNRSQAYTPSYNIDYYRDDIVYSDFNTLRENSRRIISDSEIIITDFQSDNTDLSFHFNRSDSTCSAVLQIPRYNYGLHKAYINDNETPITIGQYGMISIEIPKNVDSGDIAIIYSGRKAYRIADICSLLTILYLVGFRVTHRKKAA